MREPGVDYNRQQISVEEYKRDTLYVNLLSVCLHKERGIGKTYKVDIL